MPYVQQWVEPDVALEYNGVIVYHAYENGDYNDPLVYWFTTDVTGDSRNFDVRGLAVPSAKALVAGEAYVDDVLRDAIDAGLITNEQ